jgi:hypothetical protein
VPLLRKFATVAMHLRSDSLPLCFPAFLHLPLKPHL